MELGLEQHGLIWLAFKLWCVSECIAIAASASYTIALECDSEEGLCLKCKILWVTALVIFWIMIKGSQVSTRHWIASTLAPLYRTALLVFYLVVPYWTQSSCTSLSPKHFKKLSTIKNVPTEGQKQTLICKMCLQECFSMTLPQPYHMKCVKQWLSCIFSQHCSAFADFKACTPWTVIHAWRAFLPGSISSNHPHLTPHIWTSGRSNPINPICVHTFCPTPYPAALNK